MPRYQSCWRHICCSSSREWHTNWLVNYSVTLDAAFDEHVFRRECRISTRGHNAAAADAADYLEGYLFDAPAGPAIFAQAAQMAAQHQVIALSLSDPWCADRHRANLRQYVTDHVNILFANEDEAISLVETDHPTSVQLLSGC